MKRFIYKEDEGLLIQSEYTDGYIYSNIADYLEENKLDIKSVKWYIYDNKADEYNIITTDSVEELGEHL